MTTWTDYRGRVWPACPCLNKWLTAYQDQCLARGIIRAGLDVYQLVGSAGKSAGTHATGGAFDIGQTSRPAIALARAMGADATWHRTPPAFDSHTHGVLRGCPHNTPAVYQIAAVDAGYNGLGAGGRGGRDDGPRPLSGRTWAQGITWANTTTKTGGFMADLTDDEQREVLGILRDLRVGRDGKWRDGPGGSMMREIRNNVRLLKGQRPEVTVNVNVEKLADEILDQLPDDLATQVVTAMGVKLGRKP